MKQKQLTQKIKKLQTKNGVNNLSPLKKTKEKIKKNLEFWKFILLTYDDTSLDKDRKETQELIDELEKELEIISRIENVLSKHPGKESYWKLLEQYRELLNERRELGQWENMAADYDWLTEELIAQTKQTENTQTQERFSIKNFLLENSYLVQFKDKEASGKSLSKTEKAKRERIYDLRDKVFSNIKKELVKYYQAVIKGDYRFDGMPEIKGGVRDWAEVKIWHLLVRLGEPNHFCDLDKTNDFWATAE